MSGFGFGTRSGLHRIGATSIDPIITISASSISEEALPGSIIGALSVLNGNGSYTFAIAPNGDPDGKFAIANVNLEIADVIDFESASFHQVTIEAANGVDPVLTRTLVITVTNAFEQPDLGALTLPPSVAQGSTLPISGATDGSSIAAVILPSGWTLDGPNRQISIAPDAPTGSQSWFLIETLPDSSNSPRTSIGSSEVSGSATAFTPEANGFVLFDSRDIVSDGAVATWTARGGRNTLVNATAGELPTKSNDFVSFDGTNDILTDSARGFGTPTSINLDAVWNADPLGDAEQFTNTGIARAPDGTWWLVNHPAGAPSRGDGLLVHFNADFTAVIAVLDLGSIYGVGTIGGPQGLVYDTDDDTLWFTNNVADEVRNISLNGTPNPSKSISFPNPAGLAIDQANGTLIILESEGGAANRNAGVMRTIDKATKAIVDSGTLTVQNDWDQMFFDQESRALFVTSGYAYQNNGQDTFVGIYNIDGSNYLEQVALIAVPDSAHAIEGIVYHDGKLYINNDSGFHDNQGVGSLINEVLTYDVGRIVGNLILFAAAIEQAPSTSGTDSLIGLGHPIGSGSYGHAILLGGTTDIRLFNRSSSADATNSTFATDTPDLSSAGRIITGIFNPNDASDNRMWIDGSEVTGVVSGGANDVFSGPVSDRVALALGGILNGNADDRHSRVDIKAIGYQVALTSDPDQREEIEGWLAHEFTLADRLPSEHPFKAAPPSADPSLNALSISSSLIEEGAPQGTVVGSLEGTTFGATLALTGNDGGRFQLNGSAIEAGPTATEFAEGATRTITIEESFSEANNSPRTTEIEITVAPRPGVFPDDWTRRAAVSVGSVSGTHTDFPMLLTQSQLADALAEAQNGGGDLRFTSDIAGTTRLACDIIVFDTVGGTAVVWVKVPSLATGTVIYAWWSTPKSETRPNADAPFGSQAVWSDYSFKYGLDQTSGGWIDSTGNSAAGSDGTSATGQVGDGASLNGSQSIETTSPGITGTAARTFTGWFQTSSAAVQYLLHLGSVNGGDPGGTWRVSIESGSVWFRVYSGASSWSAALADGSLHHIAVKHADNATVGDVVVLVDGVPLAQSSSGTRAIDTLGDSSPDFQPASFGASYLGAGNLGGSPVEYFDGTLDEVAMVALDRSNDWITTEYANQSSPATFATTAPSQDVGGS